MRILQKTLVAAALAGSGLWAAAGAGSITTVPEPSAWALASLGAVALMTIIFRRSRRI